MRGEHLVVEHRSIQGAVRRRRNILTLAAAAPWLFGGEALGLVLALFRGLPQYIRDLHAGLRGPVGPGAGGPWADPQ